MEYGKTAYKLPARFDEAEVIRQITKFLVIFKDKDKTENNKSIISKSQAKSERFTKKKKEK